jgi:hypothetical protein
LYGVKPATFEKMLSILQKEYRFLREKGGKPPKPAVYHLLIHRSQKIRDNVAFLVGMCLFTGLNYTEQRFVALRRKGK